MSKTKRFRDQHDDLLKIVTEISSHLTVEELANDARAARSLLSKLLGKLNIHLSMEDKALYPSLLDHADAKVRALAKKFSEEMGGIGNAVDAYRENWPSALLIQENPAEFITQTNEIFAALAKRIEKENNELYKTIDEL